MIWKDQPYQANLWTERASLWTSSVSVKALQVYDEEPSGRWHQASILGREQKCQGLSQTR